VVWAAVFTEASLLSVEAPKGGALYRGVAMADGMRFPGERPGNMRTQKREMRTIILYILMQEV